MSKIKVIVKKFPKRKNAIYSVYCNGDDNVFNLIKSLKSINYSIKPELNFNDDFNYSAFFKCELHAIEFAELFYEFLLKQEEQELQNDLLEKQRIKNLPSVRPKILKIIPETWFSKLRIKYNI